MESIIKGYKAEAAIGAYRIVKFGSADNKVLLAAAADAAVCGLTGICGADLGETVDVTLLGLGEVELGGTVTRDALVVADAAGKAVAATVAAGTAIYPVGKALMGGEAGDIVPVLVLPQCVANDTAIQTADVTISAAELKALNAAPKTLVAAPGAGKAIVPIDLVAFLDYNTVAYDGIAAGEDLAVKYTDGSGTQLGSVETTGFLDATADAIRYLTFPWTAALTPVANAALVAQLLVGEIATGNSPLKVRVRYRVIPTAL